MRDGPTTGDLFSPPAPKPERLSSSIDQDIDDAMQTVLTAPDYESACPHSARLSALIKLRSAARVAANNKARETNR